MSKPSTYNDGRSIRTETGDPGTGNHLLSGRLDALVASVRMIGFWTAVALPFLYVPLLAAGLESADMIAAFLLLLAINLVALLVGYPHNRTRAEDRQPRP